MPFPNAKINGTITDAKGLFDAYRKAYPLVSGVLKISKPKRSKKWNEKLHKSVTIERTASEKRSRLIDEKGVVLGYPVIINGKISIVATLPKDNLKDPFISSSYTDDGKGRQFSSLDKLGEGAFGRVKKSSILTDDPSPETGVCTKIQDILDTDPKKKQKIEMIHQEHALFKAHDQTVGELIIRKSGNKTKYVIPLKNLGTSLDKHRGRDPSTKLNIGIGLFLEVKRFHETKVNNKQYARSSTEPNTISCQMT
ncbi:MAG: hypothetical protein NTW08_07300 [Gammaproteobacteria bacterium]|nr:hypothetical protein [Gammaproteobacteria bacterium]